MNMSATGHITQPARMGNPNRPELKNIRRLFYLILKSDPHPSAGQLQTIQRFMMKGDPLADAVVAMYKDLPAGEGRKLLEQALENGIHRVNNPPQALIDLFAQVDDEPIWLARAKLKLGCDVSRRVGASGELVLRNLSLMGG